MFLIHSFKKNWHIDHYFIWISFLEVPLKKLFSWTIAIIHVYYLYARIFHVQKLCIFILLLRDWLSIICFSKISSFAYYTKIHKPTTFWNAHSSVANFLLFVQIGFWPFKPQALGRVDPLGSKSYDPCPLCSEPIKTAPKLATICVGSDVWLYRWEKIRSSTSSWP